MTKNLIGIKISLKIENFLMVALVQRLERLAVAEEVMGSNPIGHPSIFILSAVEGLTA